MLPTLLAGARRLWARYPTNPGAAALRASLMRGAGAGASGGGRGAAIAIQSTEDPLYFAIFAAIALRLRDAVAASAELVIVRSINGAVGGGWLHALARSGPISWIITRQWQRAYRGLIDGVAYRSQSLAHPLGDLADWFRSRALWRRLRASLNITALEIAGVRVGDLINDSYLRFRPAPRLDVADPFVHRLLWQAHRDIRRARAYFRRRRPGLYLTTYSTYIVHGIAVRVALQEGVPVWAFGSFNQFGKRLTVEDSVHTPDASGYRRAFDALDRPQERLAQAEQQLRLRLSGGIDAATGYMKDSAYADTAEPLPDVRGAVVVFLHDFYDSPHVYHDLVFPDFWSWVCCTIDTLRDAGTPFLLKPHPNQIALSGDALRELQARYDGVAVLSPRVTNAQLVEGGIVCGVTVYGTVAHELAFLGVPTIACARHPHAAFDFCRTAHSVAEYRDLLRTPGLMPVDRREMRRQALAFYYMHNLYGDDDARALKQDFVAFWKACNGTGTDERELVARFERLSASPGFAALVDRLAEEIRRMAEALPATRPAGPLHRLLRTLALHARSAVALPFGFLAYRRTGRTPEVAYQSFIWMFCATGGRFNDCAIADRRPLPTRDRDRPAAWRPRRSRRRPARGARRAAAARRLHRVSARPARRRLRPAARIRPPDAGARPAHGQRVGRDIAPRGRCSTAASRWRCATTTSRPRCSTRPTSRRCSPTPRCSPWSSATSARVPRPTCSACGGTPRSMPSPIPRRPSSSTSTWTASSG